MTEPDTGVTLSRDEFTALVQIAEQSATSNTKKDWVKKLQEREYGVCGAEFLDTGIKCFKVKGHDKNYPEGSSGRAHSYSRTMPYLLIYWDSPTGGE